jgi:ATP-binding cassette, subfamily B, multidrug efflux pump
VIKSFVQEDSMLNHFEESSENYKQQAIKLAKVEALYFPSMTLLIGLSTLFTIMIGGLYYIKGHNNIGLDTLVEFIIYINMLTFPVSAIGWTASMIQRASASQKRLNEFLDIKPTVVPGEKKVSLRGDILFEKVDFTYEHTGIQAVKNFNLHIGQGQKIAIVGRTGSGKTTLAQLLMRMFDTSSGSIYLDGINIRELDKSAIRQQISYVPQDGFLFSDTVQNNIAFGAPGASLEEVKEAARLAVVNNDIENFTEKYQTAIGERGVTLSGGQKQRVSIARALLKPSPVLILDDCLSAVDARTEKMILENLKESLEGRTAIMITHRIFSLFHFDKIVVLQEGSIVEEGTHDELLKQRGIYYSMYLKQLREEHHDQ